MDDKIQWVRETAGSWFISDDQFNKIYPPAIQLLAKRHWTPLKVAELAARFLATEKGDRILDIGSGAGKFCLAGGYYQPTARFYGVEQRADLVEHARNANAILELDNVTFIHRNLTDLPLTDFDHFYFFNSFFENLAGQDKIDENVEYSVDLYNYYTRYLYKQLKQKPIGTRIATYHSLEDEIPAGYHVVGTEINDLLKFWVKVE
jgi:SAM-dependent methyltransferase